MSNSDGGGDSSGMIMMMASMGMLSLFMCMCVGGLAYWYSIDNTLGGLLTPATTQETTTGPPTSETPTTSSSSGDSSSDSSRGFKLDTQVYIVNSTEGNRVLGIPTCDKTAESTYKSEMNCYNAAHYNKWIISKAGDHNGTKPYYYIRNAKKCGTTTMYLTASDKPWTNAKGERGWTAFSTGSRKDSSKKKTQQWYIAKKDDGFTIKSRHVQDSKDFSGISSAFLGGNDIWAGSDSRSCVWKINASKTTAGAC